MGAIHTNKNKPVTIGDNYKQVTTWNIRNIGAGEHRNNIRFAKDGKDSVLNDENLKNIDKEDLQSICEFIDTNKDGNITYRELADGLASIMFYSNEDSHISEDGILDLFETRGIQLKNVDNLAEFLKAAEVVPDASKNIKSGAFNLGGKEVNLDAKENKNDSSERTYTLTDSENNKTYTASFGGQSADVRQMVSEFYAKAFNNPDLKVQKITQKAPTGGDVEGVVASDVDASNLDVAKKAGLDAFFSNDETQPALTYAGTLGETSNDINTSFSFIPNEFAAVLSKSENQNLKREDLAKALDAVSSFSDEDIHNILNQYKLDNQYGKILTKRKEFFAEMKAQLDKTPQNKGESIIDYEQRVRIATMENMLDKTTDIADLKAYSDSLKFIKDDKIKQDLELKINAKHSEFSDSTKLQPRVKITHDRAEQMLETFGFTKQNNMMYLPDPQIMADIKKRYPKYTNVRKIDTMFPDKLIAMLSSLKDERCVPKTREEFEDFWVVNSVMGKTPFDKPAYDLVLRTIQRNEPNPLEEAAIYYYKSDNNYTAYHSATDAKFQRNVDPTPEMKQRIEQLDNYLHKNPTVADVTVYRGEHADVFSQVKMPDGTTLADKLMEVKTKIPSDKKKPIPAKVMEEINQIISFINENGCEAINTRFCSTSLDENTANQFNDFGLKLNVPAGSPVACIDARNIKQVCKGESEVLSPPGSQEIITGAYFDDKARRIILTGTLVAQ